MNSIKVYCIANHQSPTPHYFYIKKKFIPLLTKEYSGAFYYTYCPICGTQNKIAIAEKIKWIK